MRTPPSFPSPHPLSRMTSAELTVPLANCDSNIPNKKIKKRSGGSNLPHGSTGAHAVGQSEATSREKVLSSQQQLSSSFPMRSASRLEGGGGVGMAGIGGVGGGNANSSNGFASAWAREQRCRGESFDGENLSGYIVVSITMTEGDACRKNGRLNLNPEYNFWEILINRLVDPENLWLNIPLKISGKYSNST